MTWVIGETLAVFVPLFAESEEFVFRGREIMSFHCVCLMNLILHPDHSVLFFVIFIVEISKNLKVGINFIQKY